MLLADSKKARLIDMLSIEKYNIPSSLLMENAGLRVADEALLTGADTFCVVIGKGNNGGDGSVCARHLFCSGKNVTLVLVDCEEELSGDAGLMYDAAKSAGVSVVKGFNEEARDALFSCQVIVDGLLGIGLTGAPRGVYKEVIEYINSLDKYVVAIDIPSGVICEKGTVPGVAVRCKKTVTFNVGRLGLCLYPGKEYAGEVLVKNISFVPMAVEEADIKVKEIEYIKSKAKPDDCHKGSVGRVLLAAGSLGMTGAAYIASTSALKAGSGVVSLCIPKSLNDIMAKKLTEVMTVPLNDKDGVFTEENADDVIKLTQKYDALVIGCGLGNTGDFVNTVVKNAKCPMVIDADGLNYLDKEVLKTIEQKAVITPHIGEMSRLTGYTADYIKENLCLVAEEFAKNYKVSVVLKCATTVAAFPDGDVFVNTIGNRGMATAGSGDALAGITGAFIAMEDDFKNAVLKGVYIHSYAGDKAAEKYGRDYMSAMDIVNCLRGVV